MIQGKKVFNHLLMKYIYIYTLCYFICLEFELSVQLNTLESSKN